MTSGICRRAAAGGLALAAACFRLAYAVEADDGQNWATPQAAQTPESDIPAALQAGNGAASIDYQHVFQNGDWWDHGPKHPNGSVIANSVTMALDYFVFDRWSVDLSLPFVQARYSGPLPHPVVTLMVPHTHTVFVDDGNEHGTWQDWNVGVGYHADFSGYYVTPAATRYIPSHEYTFYGAATVGDDLQKTELSLEVSHQLELSDFFYRARLGHVFAQKTLGINVDYNALDFDLGYFVNPRWAIRFTGAAKNGSGAGDAEISAHCPPCSDEFWFLHDRFRKENYANAGLGVDFVADERYTFSASAMRMLWGQDDLNMKYGLDVRLSRRF